MRPNLPIYNRVQLVGFLIGPLAPFGDLVRFQVQPAVRDNRYYPILVRKRTGGSHQKSADDVGGGALPCSRSKPYAGTGRAKQRQPASTPAAPTSQLSETPQDPASTYAERVETYWLPAARALPDAPPKDDPAFGKLLTRIDELAIDAADGSALPLSPLQRALRSKFMTALSDKQAKLLPAMRREYAKALDAKLFRDDVRVSARGTTLTLVGAVFARNANAEDMQTELGPVVNRLRFRRIAYRWSPYLDSDLHYDLDPPGDRKVARWDGAAFSEVGK